MKDFLCKRRKALAITIVCILVSTGILGVTIPYVEAQLPVLSIDPSEVTAFEGNNFRVGVNITDVTDLYAWDITLSFDPEQVNFTNAREGPFLRNVGPTIWVTPVVDYENGTIHMGCTLLVAPSGASGNGVLAYLDFVCLAPGTSTLGFNNTLLYDSTLVSISHVTVDGNVTQIKRFMTLHAEEPLVPIHMHSNKSLAPIHMHSNVTLTPVHMHFTGPPGVDPIYEPVCTEWHELYPEYCQMWHLTSWEDNGDGILSVCDQIDMTNMENEEVRWYHVDRITYTLILSDPEFPEIQIAVEFKGPPDVDPITDPVCTLWHEVWPNYSLVHHIVDWIDNGNGVLDYCDYIQFDDGTFWHVEDVATDLILREKIANPICTSWHELYPEYCQWRHITNWEDNGDELLTPCDQIEMSNDGSWEEMWDTFWSMGDVNRDGYIDETDLEIIEENYGWTGPPGENPADINSDGQVNTEDAFICAGNYGLDIWTYFEIKWYHVDRLTITLNVTKEFENEYMLIEFKGSFEDLYYVFSYPIGTLWHEVYPSYSNVYDLTWWDWWEDDNCNGVLDVCDYIWLYNQSSGLEERYHVDDICYDIILNEKIMDPRCTYWHELYPNYCQEWHLTSWEEPLEDPYPGRLSPGDQIDMNNTETGEVSWFYVDRVTLTLHLTHNETGYPFYFEFKGSFEDIYKVKTEPVCTLWTMIWPEYLGDTVHLEDWIDNCNGVLDNCDYILLSGVWYHVEEVAIDMVLTEKISDPVCTYWHEIYPEYCNEYHIEGWEDNGDGLLTTCDVIDLKLQPEGPTEKYHVENVTITLYVTNTTHSMYIEFEIGDAPIEDALVCMTDPVFTLWHEIYPVFCREYEVLDWDDNCNGVLDYCDWILLQPFNFPGDAQWWHIEEVAIDILVKKMIHDVAVTNAKSRFAWVYQGIIDPIDVTVENEGDYTETVNVYAYYDGNLAAPKRTVVLNPGDKVTLTFSWRTDNVPLGSYTISAKATIPVDDDPTDNTLIDGMEKVVASPQLYWKKAYPDYAPSGVPDFDQRQIGTYPWQEPWSGNWEWSHCAPVAVANSLWWYDSKFETNTVPPPAIVDNYPLVTSYNPGVWDDHDPQNVQPLVEHLAYLMDTDGRRTGLAHIGTTAADMQAGIAHYLSWSGVNPLGDVNGDGRVNQTDVDIVNAAAGSTPGSPNWDMRADIWPVTTGWPDWGPADNIIDANDVALVAAHLGENGTFYERTIQAPDFPFIEEEIEKSEDVILMLGFWYFDGDWIREDYPYPYGSGHCVTAAGVNSTTMQIAISDPIQDNAEPPPHGSGGPGRVYPPSHPHPPNPPDTVHNDAAYVSQDIYNVTWISPPLPPCPGGNWSLVNYSSPQYPPFLTAVIEWAITVSPLGVHDVAVTNVTSAKNVLCQGYCANITVTVENQGDFTETFNVTAYANTTVIGTKEVTLTSGESKVLTFVWNATGFAKGNYTLSASASQVSGEIDVADNTFIDGWIVVSMVGDVTGVDGWPDGKVNMRDIGAIARCFGSQEGDPEYNANYDIVYDGKINMRDIGLAARHFGETDP